MYQVGFVYSILAGIMSIVLFFWALKNKDERIYLFSLLFLIVSWSGIEWALWILGYNLFKLVLQPIVPLASYFGAWTILVIYTSERFFKRRDWIMFLLTIIAISIVAHFCMDCIRIFP